MFAAPAAATVAGVLGESVPFAVTVYCDTVVSVDRVYAPLIGAQHDDARPDPVATVAGVLGDNVPLAQTVYCDRVLLSRFVT